MKLFYEIVLRSQTIDKLRCDRLLNINEQRASWGQRPKMKLEKADARYEVLSSCTHGVHMAQFINLAIGISVNRD